MNQLLKFAGLAGLSLALIACGSDDDDRPVSPSPSPDDPDFMTVMDVAEDSDDFDTLVTALEATDLDDVLDDPNETFTVFAPTDAAFAALGDDAVSALLDDPDTLSDILLYHVISGNEVASESAIDMAGSTVEMANGDRAALSLWDESLLINLSLVTVVDIEADNGVIHVIDAVLTPPEERGEPSQTVAELAMDTDSLSTLVSALETADLVGTLNDPEQTFTVFAPTNAAFEQLGDENVQALLDDPEALNAVLTQHVVAEAEITAVDAYAANGTSIEMLSGAAVPVMIDDNRWLRVGDAVVSMTDVYATNGIVHIIDSVIVGEVDLPSPPMSIVSVAANDGNFDTLVAALEATGLDEALADLSATYTVFAPTDEAFDRLGNDTLTDLMNDPDRLEAILRYHVLADIEVLRDDAVSVAQSDSPILDMLSGERVGLSYVDNQLYTNASSVISANVMAENGVIHALDRVMMPPMVTQSNDTITATAAADARFSTLVDALVQVGLDATLDDTGETFTVFAPTNAAFEAIPESERNALLADDAALTNVLSSHVVTGLAVDSVTAYTLNGKNATTASGAEIPVRVVDGQLTVGGAVITEFDIQTTNGTIHVIDTVIMPE